MKGRARRIDGIGSLSKVVATHVPEPGPGELLLAIHATSVNYHDLVGIAGGIADAKIPRVPFSDASATVLSIGAGVGAFRVGDAVIPAFFPHWISGPISRATRALVLGDQIDGTLQTHLLVLATSVVRAPTGLSHEQIATLGCAGLTAWRSLVVEAGVRPGQTVVLQGTGGVSLFALGFAKMLGARVIITSSSDEKLARARDLGADVLINYTTSPNWADDVLAATDGGAEVIVEVGGGATLANSIRAVKTAGHISIIGVLTGFEAANFPLAEVMMKNATVRGITVGSISDLDAMCRAIELHAYQPVIDKVFDLDTADEAVKQLQRQAHFGKIAIRMG